MAKTKTTRRRSSGTALAGKLQTMQALAGAAALYGAEALKRLPHGFESLKAGQGKKPLSNKRVQLLAVLVLFLVTRTQLKWRLWSIPAMALLTIAVQQHRLTYQEESPQATELTEEYN